LLVLSKKRLLIFIRHLKGILRELEKMVEEIDENGKISK
jgi:hypothetical protein